MNTNMTSQQQFAEGSIVYDANGDKVGTLSGFDPQGNFLIVEKGLLFPHELYIPASSVTSSDANGIQLTLSKAELKDERYKKQPNVTTGGGLIQSSAPDEDIGNVKNRRAGVIDEAAPAAPLAAEALGNQGPRRAHAPADVQKQNDITVPVREEELIARKQQVEEGRVHIHKDVGAEQQTINVPVTREEMRVERVPVEGAAADEISPDAFQDRDIEIPLMGETVSAEKVARVNEEVHVHKQQVTGQERVSGTVRKERVRVDGLDDQGDVPLDRAENHLTADDQRLP